ncbi:AI-2E family transporter [Hyphomicrobium sp.]|uniref:AI-2E family transporter n=1 Tax=Hyphomicrobium sp. TaxID=82 RepID=UPI002E3252CA|nr:AI-2E family transporter [Hyphomicrobium sp.]HEX2840129.1 AI-2E family transporter [Hyphomicrobium sp.]
MMSEWVFIRRVLTVFAIGALALALWALSELLLLIFASVLFAVAFRAMSAPLVQTTGMSRPWALVIVVLAIVLLLSGLVLQFGTSLANQTAYLVQTAPAAFARLAQQFQLDSLSKNFGGSMLGAVASGAMSIGSSVVAAVTGFALSVVGGLYLAASPDIYRRGLITLFPERWHTIVTSTVDDSGFALSRWLKAQLIAMAIVGTLTGIGMGLVGVPSPLALGLIAGVLEFIPIVGPILGAIPALLLASGQGLDVTLWALAVAIIVQQLENNVIMPFVVGRVVEMPAAVGLFATVAMGLLFGPLGFVLGYPLAIVGDVAVRRLYVREALGKAVEIPAERERKANVE